MKRILRRLLAACLAVIMAITVIPAMGLQEVKAAGNAPARTYTFDQIKQLSNIPVMNLTMADSSKYDTLKTVKDKQNISGFELVNTNGKGSDISLSATVDEVTGKTVYPLTAKGRGNSSWTMATGKKPYNLKFDKKQDLLGLGKAKSWCLIANWVDTTFVRNYMAYKLAGAMGMGTPDCEMVALCINGNFEGLYLLTEKVGLNEFRTETAGDGQDVNGDGIVTDIIIEADSRAYSNAEPGAFTTKSGIYFVPKDPDPEDLAATELPEIQNEVNAMEQAVLSGTNYDQYIDVDSWVDTYIINELAKNPDFGFGYQPCYSSTYLYFQEGGKVYAGPVWDFDVAYGRNNYGDMPAEGNRDTAGTTGFLTNATKYYKELFENTDFQEHVIRRWKEIRQTILPTWSGSTFQQGYEEAKTLAAYDFEIWGDYTTRVAGTFDVGRNTLDFEGETAYVRNFIQERIAWLDTQWNVDEIEKNYSNGTWSRYDIEGGGNYSSYSELLNAAKQQDAKTNAEEVWDGGFGGSEKAGTTENVYGSQQQTVPGVPLANPITITMEPQQKKHSWDDNYDIVSNVYEWWRDGEGKGGIGSKTDLSITVSESGRYVGITSQSWYLGNDSVQEMGETTQVYVVDVAANGAVTLYDGSVAIGAESRAITLKSSKYGNMEAVDGGYKVSFKSDQSGNAGSTFGGGGESIFGIYLPDSYPASGLTVIKRPANSQYNADPLSVDAVYIQSEGEKPASWEISGDVDAVRFDEAAGKVTAQKAGTVVITGKSSTGMTSSVTIICTEKTAAKVELENDPTLGVYFTNGGTLKATAGEKGTWATIKADTLVRFSYTMALSEEDCANAKSFIWKTKEGYEILGGNADYYVFVNGQPLFAATGDGLDYSISGFDSGNTALIQADSANYNGLYAYMSQMSGSTAGRADAMVKLIKAGDNTIDIFVYSKNGAAIVRPYLSGKNTINEVVTPTPEPTVTPEPTETPTPTATPEPTETPAPTPIPVERVTVSPSAAEIKEGETVALTVSVEPVNAENKAAAFVSDNTGVATVDENGLVKGISAGTATITVTVDGKTATVDITVVGEESTNKYNLKDMIVDRETLADKHTQNGIAFMVIEEDTSALKNYNKTGENVVLAPGESLVFCAEGIDSNIVQKVMVSGENATVLYASAPEDDIWNISKKEVAVNGAASITLEPVAAAEGSSRVYYVLANGGNTEISLSSLSSDAQLQWVVDFENLPLLYRLNNAVHNTFNLEILHAEFAADTVALRKSLPFTFTTTMDAERVSIKDRWREESIYGELNSEVDVLNNRITWTGNIRPTKLNSKQYKFYAYDSNGNVSMPYVIDIRVVSR